MFPATVVMTPSADFSNQLSAVDEVNVAGTVHRNTFRGVERFGGTENTIRVREIRVPTTGDGAD